MRRRSFSLAAFPMSLALAACGAVDDPGPGDDPDDPDDEDVTAPSVVSSSPADGEAGVRADASVVIVFSEPMDAASVEGTLDTRSLGDVTLSWNAAGDTLTITPVAGLAYAEGIGVDPSIVTPEQYQVVIGTAALDRAGNPITGGYQAVFTTLKMLETTFELDQALTGTTTAAGGLVGDVDDPIAAGDSAQDVPHRGLFTFDLATLPEDAVEVIAATFTTRQIGVIGTPYVDLGAALQLEHVSFSEFDGAAYDAAPHAAMGEFAEAGQVTIEVDTTAAVEDDRANRATRGDRSQYRLRFEVGSDGDATVDAAFLSRDLAELTVTYLHP